MKCAFNKCHSKCLQSLISQIKVLNRVICKSCPKHDFCCFLKWLVMFSPQVTSEKNLRSGGDLQTPSLLVVVHCTSTPVLNSQSKSLTPSTPFSSWRAAASPRLSRSPRLLNSGQLGSAFSLHRLNNPSPPGYCFITVSFLPPLNKNLYPQCTMSCFLKQRMKLSFLNAFSNLLRTTQNFTWDHCLEAQLQYSTKRSLQKGLAPAEDRVLNI